MKWDLRSLFGTNLILHCSNHTCYTIITKDCFSQRCSQSDDTIADCLCMLCFYTGDSMSTQSALSYEEKESLLVIRLKSSVLSCRLYDDNVALYGKRYYYYIWELPLFCLIGIIAGLVGAAFVRLYVVCSRLRAKYIPASNPYRRLAEVSIAFSKPIGDRLRKNP